MSFASLTFLYLFLPGSILLYAVTPKKRKNTALALLSAAFYLLAQPENFWLFALTVVLQFALSEWFSRSDDETLRRRIRNIAVLENGAVLLYFSLRSQLFGTEIPIGVMVISFTAIGYFIDAEKGTDEPIRSFPDFVVFLGFFGKLWRGPLSRLSDSLPAETGVSLEKIGEGLYLFLCGLAKYVLLARPLGILHEELVQANLSESSVIGAWVSVISLGMELFYDLSGFCDMARGLGFCFGLELPKNFYYPFQSPSVTDFLDRFNMTVTAFFRHYVYDSLRTRKDSFLQFCADTLLVAMLCGIWFGIRMNFVLWGIYIGLFMILEELFLGKILQKIPKIFARVYTFCVTMFSMTFFTTGNEPAIWETLKAMFGFGASAMTEAVSYVLSKNVLVLIIGFFFLTSTLSMGIRALYKKSKFLYNIFAAAGSVLLLVLITGELL